MRFQPLRSLAAVATLAAALVGHAHAQLNLPFGPAEYQHDFQLFAPMELDLDNQPPNDQFSGYFFEYNKLFWWYTGERVTVGSPNVVEFAEIIYYLNPQDLGEPPPPHQIFNTLHDVPPKAGLAYGDRYEIGYRSKNNGWVIGVLDGPKLHQTEFYGFVPRFDGGLPPFLHDDYTGPDDLGPPDRELISADPGLRAFGWGSVPVLFETPPGYLMGFRDYVNAFADAITGTQGGPFLWIGNYSAVLEAGIDDDPTIPFFRLADDLNGNGIMASDIFIFIGPDGVARVGIIHDFEDLHQFNIFFDNVTIRNVTNTDAVELMWTHRLSNRHWQAKHQNNYLELSWGARYFRLYDQFRVDAAGSILGNSFWDTSYTNQIVGPQVGVKWVNQRQRWKLQGDGRFLFGYNTADWDQIGLMGEELMPGALNRPLYARPTAFSHGFQRRFFSPVAEWRAQASYYFTRSVALNFGYTGMFVGNIRRAAPSVRYALPDMGYVNAGGQTLLINGFDFGVELAY